MTAEHDTWDWLLNDNHPSFCLTFVERSAIDTVLRCYGADLAEAQLLTEGEAVPPDGHDGSVLRLGSLGHWTFCFETFGTRGIEDDVLRALSRHGETLCVLYGSPNYFHHWRDGRQADAFEPGNPTTTPPSADVSPFREDVERRLAAGPDGLRLVAVLDSISVHTRHRLTSQAIEGPLLTAFPPARLPAARPEPPTPVSHRGLGRFLGTIAPDET
ncbi:MULTISPECIES: DUF6461 domain-containing protein [Streptomycetaceae]|uniref:Uncharacterized protein n=1 Tax=Streptantibioticus cattleyicolor (strain ATCC 35852 / DSM 46488 / JCM 4925 / NBRC 14057 / NRRL 8057) TaxID=1003195 RepID=F8JU15_STREN|nr:DUF6461 domain-containing protein [Streptantibioticus cattleyicolor]AEW93025.1 hypothetical protein SCATT_06540 [Streptantibioticus cattleyicolor NRRL 8057 = DSM 46488]MYS57760.1 hypothetical protein [Streptomyces sp. SID5468]CCB73385.1 conserved protein of unknown function [Streptantibioticus cattleyicolor NRRL 8057 = DSM 46488]